MIDWCELLVCTEDSLFVCFFFFGGNLNLFWCKMRSEIANGPGGGELM